MPVKVLIPVNLRKIFNSGTLRNFVLYASPSIDPRLGEYTFEELCDMIAVVPQKAQLFKGDIRSNVAFGNDSVTDEDIWSALEAAQAKEFVLEKEGLETAVEQNGANFSGGLKQRLTIARALAKKPTRRLHQECL